MTPGEDDLWFLPLGGCGEIGMNLNLYGTDGRWLMVDCGITFARQGAIGPRIQMPDPEFIVARQPQLEALVITHAHEDHVGAVVDLWPRLRCPVYTTPFTAAILSQKAARAGLNIPVKTVRSGDQKHLGPFTVEWLAMTHSTPESQALMISTASGNIFHTGDWKLDDAPVVGRSYDERRYRRLAQRNVLAMVCDSTNATLSGRSVSEGDLNFGLRSVVGQASARVIVGCFGSNVARLRTLSEVAVATGRYTAILGLSLQNYLSAARATGYWPAHLQPIASEHLGYLPREEVLAIATGSQGERRAALDRLADDTHPDLSLEPEDTVILSSRTIPGNEDQVMSLVRRLEARGVRVIQDEGSDQRLHASGHPARDELMDLYQWVQPAIAIPVHGEARHMLANAEIARQVGVPKQMVGQNGDLFMLAPMPGLRRGAASVGRLGRDARGLVKALAVPDGQIDAA